MKFQGQNAQYNANRYMENLERDSINYRVEYGSDQYGFDIVWVYRHWYN